MKKSTCTFLIGLWLVGSARIVLAQVPTFKDGDAWLIETTRQNQVVSSTDSLQGSFEIVIVQSQPRIYQIDGERKIEVPVQSDGPTQGLSTWIGKSEQRVDLKFPLSVGQKWSYDYKTRPTGTRQDQSRTVEVNVVGMEQVTTPAGTFQAYKLVKTDRGTRANSATSTRTYFYRPEARSIVLSSSENSANQGTIHTHLVRLNHGS